MNLYKICASMAGEGEFLGRGHDMEGYYVFCHEGIRILYVMSDDGIESAEETNDQQIADVSEFCAMCEDRRRNG